jgi:hypothetical protein
MASNLAQRITFAVIAIPVALGVVWPGGWPLVGLLAVVGALGSRTFDLPCGNKSPPSAESSPP